MITAILVDDEENNLSALKEKINRHCKEVKIIAICDNAEMAIKSIDSLQPDIVFLDIEMPVMNGFLMLQQLSFKNFELIFATAYDHYAIKAIQFSALDYLIKPIEIEDLKRAVNRAVEKKNNTIPNKQLELLLENLVTSKQTYRRIAIPTASGLEFIKTDDIVCLEASINYTYLYLDDGVKYTVSRTLKDFEDMLPAELFLRIHNSYIINKNYIKRYIRGEGGQVVMSNGMVLDVSKRKKAEFLKSIGH
ncbi:MAG: LytTR family DNA-binding domain-containing protein [Chitinophagaceae bacterium]